VTLFVTGQELTTRADFHSSRHCEIMFVGWASVHDRQFHRGRNT